LAQSADFSAIHLKQIPELPPASPPTPKTPSAPRLGLYEMFLDGKGRVK